MGGATLTLLRFFDHESYDVALVRMKIDVWAKTCHRLIVLRQAHQIPNTFTSTMIQNLRKPRNIVIKGRAHAIGGDTFVTSVALDKAYGHMNAWLVLAIEVVHV